MSELTNRIRSKYPQYQNIPDQELESRVLAKYPQYKSLTTPQKSVGGFAKNVVTSGVKLLGDTASAALNVFNPNMQKNTVANIARLTTGAAQLADPTRGNQIVSAIPGLGAVQDRAGNQEGQAKAVGQFYKDRYGGIDNIANTIYNDPVGVVADAATVATGIGGALRGGGAAATKLGLAGKSNTLTRAGRTASNIGRTIDPLMVAGKGVSRVGGAVASKVRPTLFNRADRMVTAGIGTPDKQYALQQKAGRSVSSFIDEYDLYDRSSEKAAQVVNDIGEQFDTSAMNANKSMSVGQIIKAFDDEIAKLSEGSGGQIADATQQKINELQRLRQKYLDSIVQSNETDIFKRKYTTAGTRKNPTKKVQATSSPINVPLKRVTEFRKNVIDPDIPKSEFGLNPRDTGKAGGTKTARNIFRRESIKVAPELEKLGLDYGMAKELQKILEKSEIRQANRQPFNIHKLGGSLAGGVVAGAPGVIGGFLIEQIVNHPYFIKHASKGLKKALEIQLPQNRYTQAGAGLAGGLYQTGRIGRMANVNQTQPISASTQTQLMPQSQILPYDNYTPQSDLLDNIARAQGLDVEEMRKKRLNFRR